MIYIVPECVVAYFIFFVFLVAVSNHVLKIYLANFENRRRFIMPEIDARSKMLANLIVDIDLWEFYIYCVMRQ